MQGGTFTCFPITYTTADAYAAKHGSRTGSTPKEIPQDAADQQVHAAPVGAAHLASDVLADAVARAVAVQFQGWLQRIETRMDAMMMLVQGDPDKAKHFRAQADKGHSPRQPSGKHGSRSATMSDNGKSENRPKPIQWRSNSSISSISSYMDLGSEVKKEPIQPPRYSQFLTSVVDGDLFGQFCVFIILCNSILTIHTTNYSAVTLEAQLPDWMVWLEMIFLAWYTIEIGLKIVVHGSGMFFSPERNWNIFDMFVVIAGYAEVGLHSVELDFTCMRVLRLLKVGKALRALKAAPHLKELRLMLGSVLDCILPLFWALLLICLFLVIAALIFVQTITNFRIDNAGRIDDDLRDRLNTTFGSVGMAMMTTLQASTGALSWADIYNILCRVSWVSGLLFIVFFMFFTFALSNVITSIFVDKAMQMAQPDLDSKMFEKRRAENEAAQELRALALELDTDKSGSITLDEVLRMAEDSRIRHLFQLFDIEIADVELFFQMMSQQVGSSELDIEVFVATCLKMKGGASSADVQMLIFQTKAFQEELASLSQRMDTADGGGEMAASGDRRLSPSRPCRACNFSESVNACPPDFKLSESVSGGHE